VNVAYDCVVQSGHVDGSKISSVREEQKIPCWHEPPVRVPHQAHEKLCTHAEQPSVVQSTVAVVTGATVVVVVVIGHVLVAGTVEMHDVPVSQLPSLNMPPLAANSGSHQMHALSDDAARQSLHVV